MIKMILKNWLYGLIVFLAILGVNVFTKPLEMYDLLDSMIQNTLLERLAIVIICSSIFGIWFITFDLWNSYRVKDTEPKIITLCGSTKFKKEFESEKARLTLEGNIVISVGVFGHTDKVVFTEGQKDMLDDVHKKKIDLSDEIFVINVNGYIGSSTKSEIEYALKHNKKVKYLEVNKIITSSRYGKLGEE